MVKKDKTLKYIILIFAMVMSFFAFSNSNAKASTLFYDELSKVNLELEDNGSNQYVIIGASTSEEHIDNWIIPDSYDSLPIVAVKNGTNESVLKDLANVIYGKITIGANIARLGDYAFAGFSNVDEIVVPESVITIGKDAFADCNNLAILRINRFYVSEADQYTVIDDGETAGLNNVKIVFPNQTIKNNYYLSSGWNSSLTENFTYEITINLHKNYPIIEEASSIVAVKGFSGYAVGSVLFENDNLKEEYKLSSDGFNFIAWCDEGVKISNDTILTNNVDLYPKWEIKEFSNVSIGTYYADSETSDLVLKNNGDTTITYGDYNDGLKIKMSYNHELLNSASVVYSWSKKSGPVFIPTPMSEETYGVKFVNDSSTYKEKVTLTYQGKDGNGELATYETSIEKEIKVTILKRNLLINVNDNSTEYGVYAKPQLIDGNYYSIDSSTVLADGEIINSDDVITYDTYEDDYKNVNIYPNALKIKIDKIMNGETNTIENYEISYHYGTLTVTHKNITINLEENKTIEFGDSDIVNISKQYDIYGVNESVVYTFGRENQTNKNIGEYNITNVSINNSNYRVTLDTSVERKLIIVPKKVEVIWNVSENLVYDGNAKDAFAKYVDNDGNDCNLKVKFTKNDVSVAFRNAGTYTLTAEMETVDNNYSLYTNSQITRNIEKAESILSGIERQTKTYNGFNQYVDVEINHYEAIIKQKYSQKNECKNVTTNSSPCTVIAYVDETENYKAASKVFNLYINAYRLVVSPRVFEVVYGTGISSNDLGMLVDGINDEQIMIYFVADNVTGIRNVGEYDIVGINYTTNTNYVANMVAGSGENKLHVVPMPLTVEFYYYENLVYDGNLKNIAVRVFGTEESKDVIGLQIDYGNKPIRNAGKYTITASLTNPNYKITNSSTLEFSIAKARYNVADLKLEDKKVNFNFGSHFINLQGNLPTGLQAIYTIDGHDGNGTALPFKHTVKVTFEGDFENYEYVEPLVAILNISTAWIWITLGSLLVVFVAAFFILKYLINNKKLAILRRVSKRRIRRLIKKNRELNKINDIIRKQSQKNENVDEDVEIEEPIKFVKNTVYVSSVDDAISMSFVDKLFKSAYGTKQFYSEVKNELLSYEGIVSKIKRDYETFYLNNIPVAKFDIVDGNLFVYFALDPTQYKVEEYHHENASDQKVFSSVPLKLIVNSIESLRHAKMFVRIIRKREGIKAVSNFVRTDYVKVYTAKEGTFKIFRKTMAKKGEEIED